MGRMGMIWWWKSLFYPNSFLCSNPNILTIIFITLSLWWFLHGQSLLALAHLKTAPVPCLNLPVEKSLHSWDWGLLSGSCITVMSWLLIAFTPVIEASARSDFDVWFLRRSCCSLLSPAKCSAPFCKESSTRLAVLTGVLTIEDHGEETMQSEFRSTLLTGWLNHGIEFLN